MAKKGTKQKGTERLLSSVFGFAAFHHDNTKRHQGTNQPPYLDDVVIIIFVHFHPYFYLLGVFDAYLYAGVHVTIAASDCRRNMKLTFK